MYANNWQMNDDKEIDNGTRDSNDSNITFKYLRRV